MVAYYSTVATDDVLYCLNDIWTNSTKTTLAYNIYNIYLSYTNLQYTGTATSFTSYYEYKLNGQLYSNVDYVIRFLTGKTNVVMGSTSGVISSYTLPIVGQSNTFCLPLIKIPVDATDMAFGIQMTTTGTDGNSNTLTQTMLLSNASTFKSNIFDVGTKNTSTVLPSLDVSSLSTVLPSGVSLMSSPTASSSPLSLSTNDYRTLIMTTMNNVYSYYNVDLYTTTFTDLKDNPTVGNAKIYFKTNILPTSSDAVGLGCWFVESGTNSISSSPKCYTTSAQNILVSAKMNNFATVGLNTALNSSTNYTLTPSSTNNLPSVYIYSSALYPVHPYGTFPSKTVTQLSGYVASNPSSITASTINGTLKTTTSKSTSNPLGPGSVAYLFDNSVLFAAGDAEGYTPVARECLDIFFGHPDENGIYHHHIIGPMITDWCLSTTMRVIGFMTDGYPLVAPFLVKDTSESAGYRFIKTSDLNKYHGLEGKFSMTMPAGVSFSNGSLTVSQNSVTLNYTFVYVSSFDFPFTTSAFYGTAAITQ
jgi:hypothetical protein